jgi:predicted nuclease with TOPRIM domain
MKKPTELKNELDGTTKRLSELITMRDRLNTELQTLQDGFVNGKTSLDEVQTEQARLNTLSSSIKSLEDKQSELQTTFENLSAVEARQVILEKLVTLGNKTEPLLDDYLETKREFHEIINQYAEKLVKKITAYRATQKEFHNTFRQLAPEIENLQWITLELKPLYSQIIDELEKLGLLEKAQKLAIHSTFPEPALEYGQSISVAEGILLYKLNKKEQEIETARFNAESEKINAAQKAKRQEEEAVFSRALDATRQRIIQFRIDNELPPLSPQNLDFESAEIQSRTAKSIGV